MRKAVVQAFRPAITAVIALAFSGVALAQSPPARATATIGGKTVQVQYSAPSVRGRKIFGDGGLLSRDPTYPVWRAGANAATTFKTEGAVDISGLTVAAGTYTLLRQREGSRAVGARRQQGDRPVGPDVPGTRL